MHILSFTKQKILVIVVVVIYNNFYMSLLTTLTDIGFTKKEAKIYLAALALDEPGAAQIAQKSGIKRASCYPLLKSLIKKGYISSYSRRKLTRFVATSPKKIINTATERAEQAREALPELNALLLQPSSKKPKISYYEGYDGLVAIMEDTLEIPNKEILAYGNMELAWQTLADYYPTYIKKRTSET